MTKKDLKKKLRIKFFESAAVMAKWVLNYKDISGLDIANKEYKRFECWVFKNINTEK